MSDPVLDARGVAIEPGDTVIYGFGVGRSVAMAEGVVLGAEVKPRGKETPMALSLTPTGMIRVRVVRRSYSSGEKPVVAINPDRVVVLKERAHRPTLPPSPLPTQDEKRRTALVTCAEHYRETIAEIERTGEVPESWRNKPTMPEPERTPEYVLRRYREWLAEAKAELAQVEERIADG
ncbi:hypothetical protein [Streptomyces hydrogenans]|uniref:Uncharacterized protein n=1 Tax=Streptomyces hydrogenans TaxID=1873719 RepID=A0ABQ3PJI3_9ACTN|nr:hypothetical protein [Streptomyces hydrogenans]GHG10231.1 hypothetical protein GCM10018784_23680 [Streptomyces hydrogenans]GHI25180.1 hypothetical protein Shyd_65510 [Streptomyces hydrogenans]